MAPGDNLWELTERQLAIEVGRAPSDDEVRARWSAAIEANRDRFADPADPGLIFARQVLRIPARPASPSLAGAATERSDPAPDPAVAPPASPVAPVEEGGGADVAPAAEAGAADVAPVPGVPEKEQPLGPADGDRSRHDGSVSRWRRHAVIRSRGTTGPAGAVT